METKDTTNQRIEENTHNFYFTFYARYIGSNFFNVTVACPFPPHLTHILALLCETVVSHLVYFRIFILEKQ